MNAFPAVQIDIGERIMKVTTFITRKDLALLNMYIAPISLSTYTTILFISVFVFVFLSILHGFPKTNFGWYVRLISSIGGGLGGTLWTLIFPSLLAWIYPKKYIGVLGDHEYEISHQGLHEKTETNEGINNWSGIQKIWITQKYILFEITGYAFHIIPKRSFSSAQEYNDFINMSQAEWKNANNKPI